MKHDLNTNAIDINDIEARARQMRAEAIHGHAQSLGRWLRATFGASPRTRRGTA